MRLKLIALVMLTLALFSSESYAVPEEKKLTAVADEWCPYNCKSDAGAPGFMVEIAKNIFKKNGIELEYIVVPWSRAVELTRQGKYNAIIGATKGDAPDFIFPKAPQAESTTIMMTRQDSSWEYKGISSLENIVVGVIDDYSYSTDFDEYVRKNKNDRTKIQVIGGEKALELNIKKLIAGRIGAFPEDVNVINEHYSSIGEKMPFRVAGEVSSSDKIDKELFLAFSPKDPKSAEYARMLSDGMKELRSSGELKEILGRYGVIDWAGK